MTDDEIIAVVQAHQAGKTIQAMPINKEADWQDVSPCWDFMTQKYRVKPEPIVVWMNIYSEGGERDCLVYTTEESAKRNFDTARAKRSGGRCAVRMIEAPK